MKLRGSTVSSTDKDHYRYLFNFNVNGVGYEGSTYRKAIILNFAGLRQYSHTSKSKKRWLLLQQLYKQYPRLEITELHFAFDLPYSYGDLTFGPIQHLIQPRFLSTKYFDTRRKEPNAPVRDNDSIVIYDKCRKCMIARPLTRVELRLSNVHLANLKKDTGCIISSEMLQEKLVKKIERKMSSLRIKKGRGRIDRLVKTTPKEMSIKAAMLHIQGDNSVLEYLLSHRTSEILSSSRLFSGFVAICKESNAFKSKPQSIPKVKSYLDTLCVEDRQKIVNAISSYNKYDKNWYKDFLKEAHKKYRLTNEDNEQAVFLYHLGKTHKEIASALGVSESQISRLFIKSGYRKLKDSLYYFGDLIIGK